MSAGERVAVGMYVTTRGQSRGRIVDRKVTPHRIVLWLVKLDAKTFLWHQAQNLTPVTSA